DRRAWDAYERARAKHLWVNLLKKDHLYAVYRKETDGSTHDRIAENAFRTKLAKYTSVRTHRFTTRPYRSAAPNPYGPEASHRSQVSYAQIPTLRACRRLFMDKMGWDDYDLVWHREKRDSVVADNRECLYARFPLSCSAVAEGLDEFFGDEDN